MLMKHYGVDDTIWTNILTTCFHYPEVSKVILYGSRSREDFKENSDIDIAIDAPNMSSQQFSMLWNALDDLPIIYSLDIVHLQRLSNTVLLETIKTEGLELGRTLIKSKGFD